MVMIDSDWKDVLSLVRFDFLCSIVVDKFSPSSLSRNTRMSYPSSPSIASPHSVAMLSEILDEVGAFIFTKDREGRYTYANRLVLELFQVSLADLVGHKDEDFFDLQQSNQVRENDIKVLEQGITIEEEEVNIVKDTTERRVYLSIKKPMRDSRGEVVGLFGIATDVTERRALEEMARKQHHLLETIVNNVDAYIYMKDNSHHFHYVNNKVAKLFGLSAEEIIGKQDTELMTSKYAKAVSRMDERVFQSGQAQAGEESFPDQQGEIHHYWSVKVPIDIAEGEKMLIGFSSDITELHRLQAQLKHQSITDELTGLRNRRYLFETLSKELARAKRQGLVTSLLSMDVDLFKSINDQYGHPAGDKVLKRIAQIMQDNLRAEDTVARVGGEEFALLLPNTDLSHAQIFAERIRAAIANHPIMVENHTALQCTISIGIASTHQGICDVDILYSEADKKLYDAKLSGRNCVCC